MCEDDPDTERIKLFLMVLDSYYNIGIQMKQKEQIKTFMMISNCKNPLVSMA